MSTLIYLKDSLIWDETVPMVNRTSVRQEIVDIVHKTPCSAWTVNICSIRFVTTGLKVFSPRVLCHGPKSRS